MDCKDRREPIPDTEFLYTELRQITAKPSQNGFYGGIIMARKLTEEELSKVTGGASIAWGSSLSPGGGTLYTGAEISAKKAYLGGFEAAEDEGNTVITPAPGTEGFYQTGL